MKRSDFIKQLDLKLHTKWGYDMNLSLTDLHIIVKFCEDLGMLPPSIPTGASGWEVGQGMPSYINEWEKE